MLTGFLKTMPFLPATKTWSQDMLCSSQAPCKAGTPDVCAIATCVVQPMMTETANQRTQFMTLPRVCVSLRKFFIGRFDQQIGRKIFLIMVTPVAGATCLWKGA